MKPPMPPFRKAVPALRPRFGSLRRVSTSRSRALHCATGNNISPLQPFKSRTYATTSYVSAADLYFGQPVHETHPHILKAGESA